MCGIPQTHAFFCFCSLSIGPPRISARKRTTGLRRQAGPCLFIESSLRAAVRAIILLYLMPTGQRNVWQVDSSALAQLLTGLQAPAQQQPAATPAAAVSQGPGQRLPPANPFAGAAASQFPGAAVTMQQPPSRQVLRRPSQPTMLTTEQAAACASVRCTIFRSSP